MGRCVQTIRCILALNSSFLSVCIKDDLKADIPASTAAEASPTWGSAQGKYKNVKNKD